MSEVVVSGPTLRKGLQYPRVLLGLGGLVYRPLWCAEHLILASVTLAAVCMTVCRRQAGSFSEETEVPYGAHH